MPTTVEEFLLPDWESIVRRHGPMAFDTAWRLLGNAADAEEVVQDALLDAFRLHAQRTVTNWGGLLRHLRRSTAPSNFAEILRRPGKSIVG
jgi:DNA-directed RNA polymerase specialized sigma24 family protein